MYGLLLNIVSKELIALAREERFVGATPAVLSVLHTWNGRLGFHPHVHLLISGGGVSNDGLTWHEANASFLVPVKRLSKQIAKSLRKAVKTQRPELLDAIPKKAWKASWCSFCVPYGRGENAVLNYLSRYVFRMAITNHRIVNVTETEVTFRQIPKLVEKFCTMPCGSPFSRKGSSFVRPANEGKRTRLREILVGDSIKIAKPIPCEPKRSPALSFSVAF